MACHVSLMVLVHYQIQTKYSTLHDTYHPLSILLSKNVNPPSPHSSCVPSMSTRNITFAADLSQEPHTHTNIGRSTSTTHVLAMRPNAVNEQIKVHSQLLSNPHLVCIPLPTYMLKFSRFPGPPHS